MAGMTIILQIISIQFHFYELLTLSLSLSLSLYIYIYVYISISEMSGSIVRLPSFYLLYFYMIISSIFLVFCTSIISHLFVHLSQ